MVLPCCDIFECQGRHDYQKNRFPVVRSGRCKCAQGVLRCCASPQTGLPDARGWAGLPLNLIPSREEKCSTCYMHDWPLVGSGTGAGTAHDGSACCLVIMLVLGMCMSACAVLHVCSGSKAFVLKIATGIVAKPSLNLHTVVTWLCVITGL